MLKPWGDDDYRTKQTMLGISCSEQAPLLPRPPQCIRKVHSFLRLSQSHQCQYPSSELPVLLIHQSCCQTLSINSGCFSFQFLILSIYCTCILLMAIISHITYMYCKEPFVLLIIHIYANVIHVTCKHKCKKSIHKAIFQCHGQFSIL